MDIRLRCAYQRLGWQSVPPIPARGMIWKVARPCRHLGSSLLARDAEVAVSIDAFFATASVPATSQGLQRYLDTKVLDICTGY